MSRVELLRHCPKESCAHLGHAGEWEALREGGAGEGGARPSRSAPRSSRRSARSGSRTRSGRAARPAILWIQKQGRLLVRQPSFGFTSKAGCWCEQRSPRGAVVDRLSSGFRSKAGCWCGSHPSDLEARPAVGVSKGAPGAQSSTGYPLDLEARPVAPVVNSTAAGAGFRSGAGCWCEFILWI